MKIMTTCTKFERISPTVKQSRNVQVEVSADRVLHSGTHIGYHFGLTAESLARLDAMRKAGEIDWASTMPWFMKKDFPGLRIPILSHGLMAPLVLDDKGFWRCGPVAPIPAAQAAAKGAGES